MILLLLFIVIPVAEIYFLVFLAGKIGFGATLAVVILTGVVGVASIKHQGRQVLAQANRDLAGGRIPAGALSEGLLLLAAGILLITPGIFTDIVGFLLLFPPSRRAVAWFVRKFFAKRIQVMHTPTGFDGWQHSADGVIEGEWQEEKKQF